MRLDRNLLDYLFIERDSAGRSAHERQQLVIKPLSPAEPVPAQIERDSWNENQVQPVQRHRRAMVAGLANAKLPGANVAREILNLERRVFLCGGIKPRQCDNFACRK